MPRPIRTHISNKNLLFRGVPRKFLTTSIEDFDTYKLKEMKKVKDFVKTYITNIDDNFSNNVGIMMFGSNGVGKTMLASIIIKEAYVHRYTSRRVTFSDYISKYTASWGCSNNEERENLIAEFYHDYKAVEFLALEEIGKEIDSKVSLPILEDCLRYREERGFPTLICTNLSPEDISNKYGNSIMSLIKGNCKPIQIVGDDVRLKAFKKRSENI